MQDNAVIKGHSADITFKQFSRLIRLPVPKALSKAAAVHRNTLVKQFLTKLKAAKQKRVDKR